MNKKLSRLLDDDLSHEETLHLLQSIQQQPDLKHTLKRYAAISHALKTDDFLWIGDEFATRIQQAIQQLPVHESATTSTSQLN